MNLIASDIKIVYFSSISNNTHRFILKLPFSAVRIPINFDESKKILIDEPYILITPTYAGGNGIVKGAVPKQVVNFLNIEQNRNYCQAVIASGNTNFYDTYCLAGKIISKKLKIPLLYCFELLGTKKDVESVIEIINNFWTKKLGVNQNEWKVKF